MKCIGGYWAQTTYWIEKAILGVRGELGYPERNVEMEVKGSKRLITASSIVRLELDTNGINVTTMGIAKKKRKESRATQDNLPCFIYLRSCLELASRNVPRFGAHDSMVPSASFASFLP